MAITERYVTTTGTDTYANSTNSATPMSISTAQTNAAAGDRINVKAGTYSFSSADFSPSNSGTIGSPIIWRGYSSTIGDGGSSRATSGGGALVTTNMPLFSFGSGNNAPMQAKSYHLFESIRWEGTGSFPTVRTPSHSIFNSCTIKNSSTNSAGHALSIQTNDVQFVNCDIYQTGASGGAHAANTTTAASGSNFLFCRFSSVSGACFTSNLSAHAFVACLFIKAGTYAIDSTVSGGNPVCVNCTFYDIATAAFRMPNSGTVTQIPVFINCHVTDGGRFVDSAYIGTGNLPALLHTCRTRDLTNVDQGYGDWPTWGGITTDTGGTETDFTNAGSGDFTLISAAPAKGTGIVPYTDIGAVQRQESASGGGGCVIGG